MRRLQCTIDDLLDELAIKLKWSVKGHAGLKPCFRCANVIMKGHPSLSSHASFRCLTDLDSSAFISVTDQELWDAQDNLIHVQAVEPGRLAKLETACGQVCEPLGLMADKLLRPYVSPTKTRYDPYHCYFVNGVAAVEVDLLVNGLYRHRFTPDAIESYVNDRFRPTQSLRFTTNGLKGMGSDVLRAVFVLSHLCCEILQPRDLMQPRILQPEVKSFLALFDVVQTLQEMKLLEPVPQQLRDRLAIQQRLHSDAHKEAYGTQHVKPKHHYREHIPGDINHILIDTAPCERKERLIKDQIQRIPKCDAAGNVNIHLTVGVNLVQLDEMELAPKFSSLEGATSSFQYGDLQGSCARKCVTKFGATVVAGDVLVFEAVPHVLLACVVLDECLNFLVQPCSFIRTHGAGSIWLPSDARMLLQEPVVSQLAYVRFCWEALLFCSQCFLHLLSNPKHTVSFTF